MTGRGASPIAPETAEADGLTPRLVEKALREACVGAPSIVALRRRASGGTTSYESSVLTVWFAEGPPIELFAKDFGSSRLPKDDPESRAEREVRVYRELLREADLGTPAYFGAVRDGRRRWLLLEYVGSSSDLSSCGFGARLDAAAWLGRLQGRFADQARRLESSPFLVRHDAEYYRQKAREAVAAVGQIDASLAARLSAVFTGYERLVEVMASQPRTLAHGSYRPQNILIVRGSPRRRVCPVDWELAALGSPLYDLAFLTEGFRGHQLRRLLEAWRQEAEGRGVPVPEPARLGYLLDCFRLHKVARSLADAVALRFAPRDVERYVVWGEELRRSLG